jgi:hypothetical protein
MAKCLMTEHQSLATFFGWIAVMLTIMIIRAWRVARIEFPGRPSIERAASPELYWQWVRIALIIDGFAAMTSLALVLG